MDIRLEGLGREADWLMEHLRDLRQENRRLRAKGAQLWLELEGLWAGLVLAQPPLAATVTEPLADGEPEDSSPRAPD